MKKQSFHEILEEKMNHKRAETLNNTTSYEVLDSISPLFKIQFTPAKKVSATVYPMRTPKKPVVEIPQQETTPPSSVTTPQEPEIWIYKTQLSDEERSAWNLFETTMGQSFAEKVSRKQVMSAFRAFAKKNHPDVATSKTTYNFAFIIKVKNEMLAVIKKHNPSI